MSEIDDAEPTRFKRVTQRKVYSENDMSTRQKCKYGICQSQRNRRLIRRNGNRNPLFVYQTNTPRKMIEPIPFDVLWQLIS